MLEPAVPPPTTITYTSLFGLPLQQAPLHVVSGLEGGADRVQAELFIGFGPLGVVDASYDVGDLENVLGDLRRHDVPVVAFGHGDKPVRMLDPSPSQDVGVGAVADDLVAFEVPGEHPARRGAGERVRIAVDDYDLMARATHFGPDLAPHPAP